MKSKGNQNRSKWTVFMMKTNHNFNRIQSQVRKSAWQEVAYTKIIVR